MRVLGTDLRAWDVIEVWWSPKRDTIISLKPYTGAIAHVFRAGAQIAEFAMNKNGMTIENDAIFTVVARQGVATDEN